jgi:hypothetical protein
MLALRFLWIAAGVGLFTFTTAGILVIHDILTATRLRWLLARQPNGPSRHRERAGMTLVMPYGRSKQGL